MDHCKFFTTEGTLKLDKCRISVGEACEVGIGEGLVAADNLQDKGYGCDVGNVCGIRGATTAGEHTDNSSRAIDDNRPGIAFGGKSTGRLVEGQNRQLFGSRGVVVGVIFASVRDEGSSATDDSQACSPATFKNDDAGVAVLVVHLRFSHFVLLDVTPKLQEAVAGKVEVVRVL